MTNVLIIPTSGILEFNASAGAGGAPATLDSAYANAVRLEIASSATLKVTGKNASENKRLVVNGTNGDVLTVRDASSTTEGATASLTTPVISATVISATTYYGIPGIDSGQFVDTTGDTMTGPLILDGSAQTHLMLSSDGSMYASGYVSATSGVFSNLSSTGTVSSTGNQLAVGDMSSTGAHRGSSGVFTTTVQAPTLSGGTLTVTGNVSVTGTVSSTGNQLTVGEMSSTGAHRGSSGIFTATLQAPTVSGTTGTFATQVTSPTVSGTTGTFATQVVSPTVSGGTLTVTGNASVTGTVSSTGNQLSLGDMSSAGAHRGSSGIFTTTVQVPTLSGGTLTLTGNATVVNLSATGAISSTGNQLAVGDMSSTGAHRGSSGIFTTTVQAPTLSGTSGLITNVSSTDVSAATLKASTSVSAASISSAGDIRGVSAIISNTVQAPTLSGGTLTVTGNVSVTGTVSSTGNQLAAGDMSSTGAHRGSSGIFTTTVQAPTLSGGTLTVTGNASVTGTVSSTGNQLAAGDMSSTGAHRGSSGIFTTTVQAPTLSGTSGNIVNLSGTTVGATTIIPGAAAGIQPTDLTISAGTGQINVSANTGLSLSSGQAISLNATAVNVTNGTLSVTGHFAATSKAFVIDHPTPNSGYTKLQYACLEGPENGVYVRGKADAAKTDHIVLPYYWTNLVHADSITVQVTPTNPEQKLYVEKIEDNKVYIKDIMVGDDGLIKSEYFYIVHGERKDIDHLTIEY